MVERGKTTTPTRNKEVTKEFLGDHRLRERVLEDHLSWVVPRLVDFIESRLHRETSLAGKTPATGPGEEEKEVLFESIQSDLPGYLDWY